MLSNPPFVPPPLRVSGYIYIYIYIYTHTRINIYIYIYVYKERERYSIAQHSTAQHSTAPYRTVPYGTVPYRTVRYGTVRYGTIRYGTVRYGTVRYGTVRYGTIWYGPSAATPGQAFQQPHGSSRKESRWPFLARRSCVSMGLTSSGSYFQGVKSRANSPPTYRQLPRKFDPKDLSL